MQINIKEKEVIPLMQGGMGVGISLSNLAGNVAKENAIGVISAVNIGYQEEDFLDSPLIANIRALEKELLKAREIANNKGLIGVNIMCAINDYEKMVKEAVRLKYDIIISGAGLPLNLPELVDENTLIAPIVSSKRAISLIIKTWLKRYNRLPDFVIAEGPLAGGHLGFKNIDDLEKNSLEEIVLEIKEYLKEIEEKYKKKIYLFAAGGIRTKEDRKRLMKLGIDGIQIGTPFIVTRESDASSNFKSEIINAKSSDIKIINSPVGMIARAINNDFIKNTEKNRIPSRKCINCIKTCNKNTISYCITDALNDSAMGKGGLVFTGDNIDSLDKITNVKEVISRFMEE